MSRVLRVAVIGCGAMGRQHIRALNGLEGARCTTLFDADPRRAQGLAEEAGTRPRVAATLAEAANEADIAVVATPNSLHPAHIRELLGRGLHVLCEKPLCATSDEARSLFAEAAAANRVLACGLARRFYPAVQQLRRALGAGVIGKPRRCVVRESGYGWPFSKWHFEGGPAGGILSDTGPHVVDLLLHLFGRVEVLECRDDGAGGAAAETWLRLRAGADAPLDIEVHIGRSYPIRSGWRIEGPQGALNLDLQHIDRLELELGDGAAPFEALSRPEPADPFRLQFENFLEAIRGVAPLRVPPSDVVRGLQILEEASQRRERFQDTWTQPLPGPAAGAPGKILLTGASGRIGSRLVELWAASGRLGELRAVVRGYQHAARIMRFPVEVVQADLLDRGAMQRAMSGCTEVIHLAAGSLPDRETRTVAELALEAGVRRFVHMSSASIYGHALPTLLDGPQEDLPAPMTGEPYPDGKAAAERVVRDLSRLGLPAVILRPHIVYGPGVSWSEGAMEQLIAGRLCVLQDEGWANLIYVDDLIAAIERARLSSLRGAEAFFVTDGEPLRWSAYIDAHAALLGLAKAPRAHSADVLPSRRRGVRDWLSDSVRPIGPLLHSREFRALVMESPLMRATVYRALVAARGLPPFRRPLEGLRGEGQPLETTGPGFDPVWARLQLSAARLSNERFRQATGFVPHAGFEEGLRRTAPWFRAFGLLPEDRPTPPDSA